MLIPHDERSPQLVVEAANSMAEQIWHQSISFDQAASHRSAIHVRGHRLPFNAFCMQPGASGVDTFRCWRSWQVNVNFIHPPAPMIGRTATFLPSTGARVVLVIPEPTEQQWWQYAIQPGAQGIRAQTRIHGFVITAFDFSLDDNGHSQALTGLATTECLHYMLIQWFI